MKKYKFLISFALIILIVFLVHKNCGSCQERYATLKNKFFGEANGE